jgi:hypothetical protein
MGGRRNRHGKNNVDQTRENQGSEAPDAETSHAQGAGAEAAACGPGAPQAPTVTLPTGRQTVALSPQALVQGFEEILALARHDYAKARLLKGRYAETAANRALRLMLEAWTKLAMATGMLQAGAADSKDNEAAAELQHLKEVVLEVAAEQPEILEKIKRRLSHAHSRRVSS